MNATLPHRLRALLALALLLPAALAGCGRNKASHLLVPTGIQPAPPDSAGVLFGFTRHDSLVYAGLEGSPFPPCVITLSKDGTALAADTTTGLDREFRFSQLPAGTYLLTAQSHAFAGAAAVVLTDGRAIRDAGDLYLPARPESLNALTSVVGRMPGFAIADMRARRSWMVQNPAGLNTYPNLTFPPTSIAAGTYRFKFVTDFSSTATRLIGWGGDSTVVYTAPVTNARVRYASGPAEDLKVTFPTSGVWAFTLDERRLTFSIAPYVPGMANGATRSRTPR